jgi:hypothetical protein
MSYRALIGALTAINAGFSALNLWLGDPLNLWVSGFCAAVTVALTMQVIPSGHRS